LAWPQSINTAANRGDPNEWTNLASDPQCAGVKAELARHLPAKDQPEIDRKAGGDEDAESSAKSKSNKPKAKTKKAGRRAGRECCRLEALRTVDHHGNSSRTSNR
jgi:hypothetical protein